MNAPATVVVVGSLNIDLVVRSPQLPLPGETLIGDGFAVHEGGKGGNQAVAAARFGARVALLGCVGRDEHGARLLRALQADGIGCEGVLRDDPHAPSGVAAITVSHSGENCIVVVPGANALLSTAQIDAQQATLAAARVLVAQLETPWPTVVHALALARQSGVTTLLNAAPARTLGADDLAHVDWLIVNETEAQAMTGLPAADAAQAATAAHALRALGPAQVVVSLGAQGLVHAGGGRPARHWPAPRVKAVIDSTGAGDTFVGTLAAALAEGRPADEALQLGQAAAALAITRHGAQPSMPRRAEVLAAATA